MVAQISIYTEISAPAHLYQFEWTRLQNKVEMFYFSSVYVSIDENDHLNRKIHDQVENLRPRDQDE